MNCEKNVFVFKSIAETKEKMEREQITKEMDQSTLIHVI